MKKSAGAPRFFYLPILGACRRPDSIIRGVRRRRRQRRLPMVHSDKSDRYLQCGFVRENFSSAIFPFRKDGFLDRAAAAKGGPRGLAI